MDLRDSRFMMQINYLIIANKLIIQLKKLVNEIKKDFYKILIYKSLFKIVNC